MELNLSNKELLYFKNYVYIKFNENFINEFISLKNMLDKVQY